MLNLIKIILKFIKCSIKDLYKWLFIDFFYETLHDRKNEFDDDCFKLEKLNFKNIFTHSLSNLDKHILNTTLTKEWKYINTYPPIIEDTLKIFKLILF